VEIKSRKGCLGLALKVKQLTRERETQMEALVFGLIVLNNLNNEQELIVPEPTEFRRSISEHWRTCTTPETILRAVHLIGSTRMWPKLCPDLYDNEPRR